MAYKASCRYFSGVAGSADYEAGMQVRSERVLSLVILRDYLQGMRTTSGLLFLCDSYFT